MDLVDALRMEKSLAVSLARRLASGIAGKAGGPGTRCRMNSGDINIFFRRYGSGTPVLLLHGGFTFAEAWLGQYGALAGRYLVISPDSRGHVRTTLGEAEMTYRTLARDFEGLLDGLGAGPAHVVGWSDGGTAGIALAMSRPDLVRSLTLVGAPFNTSNYTPEAKAAIERFLDPRSPVLLGVRMLRRLASPEPWTWRPFHERMGRMWRELPDFTGEELARVEAPTLVVGCDNDEFLSPAEDPLRVFRLTAQAIPRAELRVISDGTHTVAVERPREFNRLLLPFLDGH